MENGRWPTCYFAGEALAGEPESSQFNCRTDDWTKEATRDEVRSFALSQAIEHTERSNVAEEV